MNTSTETNELAAALSQAQGAFPKIERTRTVKVKTTKGGEYSFDYAPLDSIIELVKPVLAENGLSYRHSPSVEYSHDDAGDLATVTQTCRLQHASGQWTDSTITLRTRECDPQKIGSVLTYGRRYTLEHVLGIAAELDDDGNAATGNESQQIQKPACPSCGKSGFVLQDRDDPTKFFCWKNEAKNKKGCGHKWQVGDAPEPPQNGNGKPDNGEHSDPAKYAEALKAIAGIKSHDAADKIANRVEERRQQGIFTDKDAAGLQDMIVQRQKILNTQEAAA